MMSRSSAACALPWGHDLHAKELACGVEDLLVHLHRSLFDGEFLDAGAGHGADEVWNIREPGLRRGCPPNGDRLRDQPTFPCISPLKHPGEGATACRLR